MQRHNSLGDIDLSDRQVEHSKTYVICRLNIVTSVQTTDHLRRLPTFHGIYELLIVRIFIITTLAAIDNRFPGGAAIDRFPGGLRLFFWSLHEFKLRAKMHLRSRKVKE